MTNCSFADEGGEVSVVSPGKQVRFALASDKGKLAFVVDFNGRPVIEESPLAISIDGVDVAEGARLGQVETYQLDESYPWRGPHSIANNRCAGARAPITHESTGTNYTLEIRAYDVGVAFRHIIPAAQRSQARVPDEATTFKLPRGARVWFHDLEGHYEATYHTAEADEVEANQWVAPPMTFQLPGGAGYGSITEAALTNYSGMALQADGKGGFTTRLGHAHHVSYPFRLRYENDVDRLKAPAAVEGDVVSPWRVVMIAADLNGLVNSDLVHNVCPPPDPQLFPEGMQTPWIKPGRAVWKYLDGGGSSLEDMKDFSRWAGELGFEHHVIEGFWNRWSDEQIRELVEYSRQRGVGLWFWRHSRELRTPERREEFFSKLERLGVVGAKIDFLDHEHKEVVDVYTAVLEAAARHQVMVNFHGANKPTGEARTWPNELTREAVRGMEARRLTERAFHNATLPFTRYLAGPGDYTPVVFNERRGDTTWAHQIATAAVFDEPLLTYGAHPETLLKNPAVEMIKAIPSVWDETIALPPCEIGKLVAMARRRGHQWFVPILNGPEARNVSIPLDFLGDGQYDALVVRDGQDEAGADVVVEHAKYHKDDQLQLELRPGGGFIAHLRPDGG